VRACVCARARVCVCVCVCVKKKVVLFFSTKFAYNISHSKKKWARYDKKSKQVFK